MSDAERLLALLDLTSLTGEENEASIIELCEAANSPAGPVAAVCVYGRWVKRAAYELSGTTIDVATVANFPDGDCDALLVQDEIDAAITDGADEIDVVFPWQAWLAGKHRAAMRVVMGARAACPRPCYLKVIIESGKLENPDDVREITDRVIDAGADFVKTSTGKVTPGATLGAASIILNTIAEHSADGRPIGFKASGGIKTLDEAQAYLSLADEILGEEWAGVSTFRLGTTGLHAAVLAELSKQSINR